MVLKRGYHCVEVIIRLSQWPEDIRRLWRVMDRHFIILISTTSRKKTSEKSEDLYINMADRLVEHTFTLTWWWCGVCCACTQCGVSDLLTSCSGGPKHLQGCLSNILPQSGICVFVNYWRGRNTSGKESLELIFLSWIEIKQNKGNAATGEKFIQTLKRRVFKDWDLDRTWTWAWQFIMFRILKIRGATGTWEIYWGLWQSRPRLATLPLEYPVLFNLGWESLEQKKIKQNTRKDEKTFKIRVNYIDCGGSCEIIHQGRTYPEELLGNCLRLIDQNSW